MHSILVVWRARPTSVGLIRFPANHSEHSTPPSPRICYQFPITCTQTYTHEFSCSLHPMLCPQSTLHELKPTTFPLLNHSNLYKTHQACHGATLINIHSEEAHHHAHGTVILQMCFNLVSATSKRHAIGGTCHAGGAAAANCSSSKLWHNQRQPFLHNTGSSSTDKGLQPATKAAAAWKQASSQLVPLAKLAAKTPSRSSQSLHPNQTPSASKPSSLTLTRHRSGDRLLPCRYHAHSIHVWLDARGHRRSAVNGHLINSKFLEKQGTTLTS
jgi:hypothetical protein